MVRPASKPLGLVVSAVLWSLFAVTSQAQAAKTCYDCHQAQKKEYDARKFVHAPVKAGDCESCHGRHGFAQNLVLKFGDNRLCYSCHQELEAKFSSGTPHAPVAKGVCWDCHDPHGSDKQALLRAVPEGQDDPASCLLCHDLSASLQAAHPHPPFNELNCLSCHEAHVSGQSTLLKQEGDDLCRSCHEKDAKGLAAAHQGKHAEALRCLDCHSGHATARPGLISAHTHAPFADGDCETCHSLPDGEGKVVFAENAPNAVCGECHEDEARSDSRPTPHPAVSKDNCSDCHKPHSSPEAKLLAKPEAALCQECHEGVLTASNPNQHVPVRAGQCGECHEVHGSERSHLLRQTGAELCLTCHATMAAARDSSASVHAAFGDCLSCHAPHEGQGPALLRKPAEQLCAECHQPDAASFTAASAHPPYVTGNCAGCHDPHFSSEQHLLKGSGPNLCLSCHEETRIQLHLGHEHAPAGEDCLTCHKAHYADEPSLLAEPPKQLCANCHESAELGLHRSHVHTAALQGDCTGCHNPHGAERVGLIAGREVPMVVSGQTVMLKPDLTDQRSSLCYVCHQDMGDAIQKSAAHRPVKEGRCEACHTDHGSDQPGFVKAPAPELCVGCHATDTLAASHQGYEVSKSDCLGCHNPHLSTAAKLVRKNSHPPFAEGACDVCHEKGPDGVVVAPPDVATVCANCHELAEDQGLPLQHPPFAGGECASCHRVHAADLPKLLRAQPDKLCLECHEDLRGQDTLVSVHQPFGDKQCTECHRPHASANAGLLKQPPETLCLSCHTSLGESLAQGPLHAPVKGGKCRACHEEHASPLPALLVSDKKSLCGGCHSLTTPAMSTAHKGFEIAGSDCQSCHAPHVGSKGRPGLLLPVSHTPFESGQCTECHGSTSAEPWPTASQQLCAKCHPDAQTLTSKKVVHPALLGPDSCGACHGPHVGFGTALQRHEGSKQCLTCHNTKAFTGAVQHAPAFEDCGICHEPHSSDNRKLLSNPEVMDLCQSCHSDAQKTHFHPMGAGVIDPRTKADLVCTACHSPHSSSEKQLLLADKNRQLCNICHGTSHE